MAAKGRIPQYFIDDLLSRVDIVDVINRRVSLKKTGKNYSACCPFHEEKTPSFSVNPDKQFYYCFGCGAAGNAVGFIMDYERQDFPSAIESLAHVAGLEVPREELSPQQQIKQERRKTIYDLMEQVSAHYQKQLRVSPQSQRAVDYLKRRGLSGRIARDFNIGFAPPGWDNLLNTFGNTDEQKQQLIDAGMLIEKEDGKLYDRFRDRIMFPIRDNRGRVIAFGGRVLGDDKPKYLNSPETDIFQKNRELYGLYHARQNNRHLEQLLIVEGYMDVVALAQHGIMTGIATLGTASNTEHLRTAFRYASELIFCFDGDAAGRKAAERALENALPVMEDGRRIRFLFLPEGDDPDSVVNRDGAAGFQKLLAKATPLERYFFESLHEQTDPDTLEGKARLSKLALPKLLMLPDGVFRQLMLDSLAERTGLSRQSVDQLLNESNAEKPITENTAPTAPQRRDATQNLKVQLPKGRRDPLLFALAMLLYNPRGVTTGTSNITHSDSSPVAALLNNTIALLRKRPESSTAMLLGHWYGQPEYEVLTEALKTIELLGNELTDEKAEAAFFDTLTHLETQQSSEILRNHVDKLRGDSEVDKPPNSNYAELSESEKQQLLTIQQLLKQKHRL
ncbi:DNA primase [Zhongshania aliphaticivorans]|uniref:DNA primase n=1 Tax=Zhongshania aliphaticivorans TaxID=1470434 RepID=A0A5S9NX60_9GAMM|nr:DNA primase [Zhongshania aliphaticivorans]CAA0095203.1 DNA primase [Zhongshania aliphaticivorans]CAA0112990.1 DNA primase [Zhongshania aliphaticivorans]